MPVYSTLKLFWLNREGRKAAIALGTVSFLAIVLNLRSSPLRSAPFPTPLPSLVPQMGNVPPGAATATPQPSLPQIKFSRPLPELPKLPAPAHSAEPTPKTPEPVLASPVPTASPRAVPSQAKSPQPLAPRPSPSATQTPLPSPTVLPSRPPQQRSLDGIENQPVPEFPAPPPIAGTVPIISNPYDPDIYRLAIGDTISIFVANVPEFTTKNVIMSDGTVNLPVAGPISLWGMTLAEAGQAVTQRYVQSDILRNPFVAVQLLASSPQKIALAGQINRPGAYNIPVVDTRLPTITDAIALAGGITGTADLKQVKVYRLSPTGTDQVIEVNLWNLIQGADLSQDITLRSGDRIQLAKAPVLPNEASTIGSANLSPAEMRVGILGEVLSPGLIKVPPNTSLNQALLLVGGFSSRAQRKTVELIRANADGTVTRQKYRVNWSDPISDKSNPVLQNQDIVLVGTSNLARYSDILGKLLSPIGQTFSFLSFFNFLFPAGKP